MVKGVRRLREEADAGWRGLQAAAAGSKLNLAVGFSHPVNFEMPGITVATPTPTEIVIKGADRQWSVNWLLRSAPFVLPSPYKGKGIRYG
jgi:large subunit ribosomal protein L6